MDKTWGEWEESIQIKFSLCLWEAWEEKEVSEAVDLVQTLDLDPLEKIQAHRVVDLEVFLSKTWEVLILSAETLAKRLNNKSESSN